MKRFSFFLLLLVQTSFAIAQSSPEKEPYLTRSLSTDAISNVEARTSGGSISIKGVAASEARIEVYVSGNNNASLSKEEIRQRLDELYNLDIAVANNKLTAIASAKDNISDWKKALNISYRIYTPQTVATEVNTSGGSIHLENISGSQNFRTSGGSLHVSKVSGKINGRTSGGSIHLIDSRDEIELHTSGGSIHAANSSGNIRLETSGGSLDLSNLKGNIRATTSGGGINGMDIEGELITHTSGGSIVLKDLKSSLETSTSGGHITLSFNQLSNYIKVNNSAGNVTITLPSGKGIDLDLSGNIAQTRFSNFNGKIDDNIVRGKLNGGGVPVTVHAGTGKIKIDLK